MNDGDDDGDGGDGDDGAYDDGGDDAHTQACVHTYGARNANYGRTHER